MDLIQRREMLAPIANPGGGRDYVITLGGDIELPDHGGAMAVTLRYVPDRHVLAPNTYGNYLATIGELKWETLEAVAVAILDDVSNELLPRWAQVSLRHVGDGHTERHDICLEECQPGWRNDDLLYRLPPI
ncbi:MAG: hypothetical protein HOH04_10210 [Rhodospirillaceae bacterium]|nr:hypothetical protein [Rhodospirillaceae bacterium]